MSKLALIPLALCMASCAGAPSVPQAPSGLAVTPAVTPVVSPAPVPARLSGLDLDGFDRSVRPQDDLFRFSSGSWLARTDIPADRSNYGTFTVLEERAQGAVRSLVEAAAADQTRPFGSDAQKVGDFYADFMDVDRIATLRTSGPASVTSSPEGGRDLRTLRTPSGKRRFVVEGDRIYQNSMVEENLTWEITQTKATVDPGSEHYRPASALAKTVRWADDGMLEWGGSFAAGRCAHKHERVGCIACHSSWNPSCFGCHLPQKANKKAPNLHYEGDVSRNLTAYNFQTLRDDVFMLARDGNATGNRIGPSRSSCAIHVSSANANRESIYVQQQTISAEGYSGIAFSTNVPHTVRGGPDPSVARDYSAHRPGTHQDPPPPPDPGACRV